MPSERRGRRRRCIPPRCRAIGFGRAVPAAKLARRRTAHDLRTHAVTADCGDFLTRTLEVSIVRARHLLRTFSSSR